MLPVHLYLTSFKTGSSYICDPPVTDTDIDEMFLVYSLEEVDLELIALGWTKCGINEYALNSWSAYRKENLNALITDNVDHYDKFEAATELAKKRNLQNKQDRINLFNRIVGKQHEKTV